MFQFPFGTMHQLNLDWFLQQWQQLRQDWIDEQQNIEDSMQDVYDARDAAIQAKDDAVSAKNDAQTAKASADADALMAEGFAVGEQNGTPVGPGSPYYQVNAKFYSTNAGTYRYLSEAYARGTMGGTPVDPGDAGYEDNAKYYKDAADLDAQSASDDAAFAAADALVAEGWAKGEQNGTPVSSGDPYYQDNAKYYAGQCAQDKSDTDTLKDAANAAALRAEGYSSGTQNGVPVASGSPYYENNAYYYFANTSNVDGQNAQKMIAEQEATTTASVAHPTGSYFIQAGKLYIATADIDIGDTITPNTNCEEITVCENLEIINTGFTFPSTHGYIKPIKNSQFTTRAGKTFRNIKNKLFCTVSSPGGSICIVSLFSNVAQSTSTASTAAGAYPTTKFPMFFENNIKYYFHAKANTQNADIKYYIITYDANNTLYKLQQTGSTRGLTEEFVEIPAEFKQVVNDTGYMAIWVGCGTLDFTGHADEFEIVSDIISYPNI